MGNYHTQPVHITPSTSSTDDLTVKGNKKSSESLKNAFEKPNDSFHTNNHSTGLAAFCPVINKKDSIQKNQKTIDNMNSDVVKGDKTNESACPVKSYKNPNIYNVYSQKIDPSNQMPAQANQSPLQEQKMPLSTDRIKSSIPKAGTDDDTWLYPSPQMFWNALVRKNKTDDASEEYMDTVVAIHNNMNENTWQQVLAWEDIHKNEKQLIPGTEPKLLRFLGRPTDLSPKAYLKTLFGHSHPFDRHDWFVDRGGKIIRYVIDYYHDEEGVSLDRKPRDLSDHHSLQSIKVDVRPALDSFESILDRVIYMPWLSMQGKTIYNPPPFFQSKQRLSQPITDKSSIASDETLETIRKQCESYKLALNNCRTDIERVGASMKLQRCVASVICPDIVKDFDTAVNAANANSDAIDNAYSKVTNCIDEFQNKHRKSK